MRPIKLIMSAFGPYAGKIEIPMNELGESGLYLITGATGTGKTTIFDAICFALYGEASGKNRETEMLRSKYASIDTPTEVDLTFLHNGKEYRIRRNPSYERRAKRGDGFTTETAQVELYYPDGQVKTNAKEVANAVHELLGITREQFAQIAMISQGEFLKLLLAESKEREKIYRELFHTAKYQSLQEELNRKFLEAKNEAEQAKSSIAQYVDGIMVESDSVWNPDVAKAKKGEMVAEEILLLLERIIEEDKKEEIQIEEELKIQELILGEIQQKIGEARKIEETRRALTAAREQFVRASEETGKKELILKEKEAEIPKEEALVLKISKIEAEIQEYEKLDGLIKSIRSSEMERNDATENLNQFKNHKVLLEEKIEALKAELVLLKEAGINKERYLNEKERAEQMFLSLNKLEKELITLDHIRQAWKKVQEQYFVDDKRLKEALKTFEQMDQAYRDGQAGILAEALEEGIPCPVCGSTSHPQKAKRLEHVPTKEALDQSKRDYDMAHKKATDSSVLVGSKKSEMDLQEKNVRNTAHELLGFDDFESLPELLKQKKEAVTTQIAVLKKQIESEEKNVSRKQILEEKELPESETKLNQTSEKVRVLGEKLIKMNTFIETTSKEQIELQGKLTYSSKEDANRVKNELQQEKDQIKKAFDLAKKSYDAQKETEARLQGQIIGYENALKDAKEINLVEETSRYRDLSQMREQKQTSGKEVHSRISNNQSTYTKIQNKVQELSQKEKKYQWLKALSDTANGKLTGGKDKITLETYIQIAYFERIIQRANLRFMKMSGAQYELKRAEKASSFVGKTGLELLVIDHYNGTERSVKSLSGGEQFMASLSLALGLSDEVQSAAGGIQIDTMFVDEGFGTLDSERLDQVYNALASITEGNCLVGIISHVSELKNKIDKQIVITKQQSGGSTAKLQI